MGDLAAGHGPRTQESGRQYLDEIEERYWADSVVKEYERTGKQSSPAGQLWDELGV